MSRLAPNGSAVTSPDAKTSSAGKTSTGGSHLPYWTPGSGHYGETLGKNSRHIIESSTDLILKFLDTVPVQNGEVFTAADYGANDGYATLELMPDVISRVRRKHGDDVPVLVIYEDQEKNDFNSLFNRLLDEKSYTSTHDRVFTMATNNNFYKQCVPPSTCNFIFSSLATNWLENQSVTFKDAVFHGSSRATDHELRQFAANAHNDWTKFLVRRAAELKQGGILVVFSLGAADDYQPCKNAKNAANNGIKLGHSNGPISKQGLSGVDICLDLEESWVQLKNEGIITKDEFERCTIHEVFRKDSDVIAPFKVPGGPVTKAGLSLVHHDQVLETSVYKELWQHKHKSAGMTDADGRAFFADVMTVTTRVHSQSSFENSLSSMRSEAEKGAIIDELYRRFYGCILPRDPAEYRADIVVSRLVARKL